MRVETQDIVPIVGGALGLPTLKYLVEYRYGIVDDDDTNRRALSAVGNAIAATVLTETAAATIPWLMSRNSAAQSKQITAFLTPVVQR